MRGPGQMAWQCPALGSCDRGFRNGSFPAGNRRSHCGSVLEMKKRLLVIALVAVALLLAGVYFWRPASAPIGQEPLIVLSRRNLQEFAAAFDAESDEPRMVLLLSPT